MYLFDPERGARRRAGIRDKTQAMLHDAQKNVAKKGEDLVNRATGLVAEARRSLVCEAVPDDKLAARVHTELGRLVTKPRTIEVIAHEGVVTLRGWAPSNEVPALMEGVGHVPGVKQVESQLAGAAA